MTQIQNRGQWSRVLSCLLLLTVGLVLLLGHALGRRGVLLSTGAHSALNGAQGATRVANHNLASSILHNARRKFLAKKSIAKRHAAHRTSLDGFHLDKKAQAALAGKKLIDSSAPTSSLISRMGVANSAKGVIAAAAYLDGQKKGGKAGSKKKLSKAAQLEYDIAHHKLTTRGLVAAVQEVEAHQAKQLDTSLKDQTDDLIIAKINQLRGGSHKSTQSYVLNNALTKGEQAVLASKKNYSPETASPSRAPQPTTPLARGPTATSYAPPGMLSSYDRQLLSGGPQSISAASLAGPSAPAPAPAPVQQQQQEQQALPPPAYEEQAYQPPAYQAAYQQPYQAAYQPPAYQAAYQQPDQRPYAAAAPPAPYAVPPYQQAGAEGGYATGAEGGYAPANTYAASAYSAYGYRAGALPQPAYQQPYAASPPYQQPYATTPLAYQQPYAPQAAAAAGAAGNGYAYANGYRYPQQYAPQYGAAQEEASGTPHAAAQGTPHAPAYGYAQAAQYGGKPAAFTATAATELTGTAAAADAPVGGAGGAAAAGAGGGGQGGGTLWRIFNSDGGVAGGGSGSDGGMRGEVSASARQAMLQQMRGQTSQTANYPQPPQASEAYTPSSSSSDAAPMSESGSGLSMGGGGDDGVGAVNAAAVSMAGGALYDPSAIVPKGNVGAISGAKKAQIAAEMKALRESIMSDFDSTKSIGDKAGYLPPPP